MNSSTTTATLRVLDIVSGTSVDGPGLRTTVYFAGCPHHCIGCHNPQSWDPDGGREMGVDELTDILLAEQMPVTFSGGDPLAQASGLLELSRRLRHNDINIWCYTGYIFEDLMADESMTDLLKMFDVVVDGPFIESLRSTALHFRGSSNQRLVDVTKSLARGEVVEWQSTF